MTRAQSLVHGFAQIHNMHLYYVQLRASSSVRTHSRVHSYPHACTTHTRVALRSCTSTCAPISMDSCAHVCRSSNASKTIARASELYCVHMKYAHVCAYTCAIVRVHSKYYTHGARVTLGGWERGTAKKEVGERARGATARR